MFVTFKKLGTKTIQKAGKGVWLMKGKQLHAVASEVIALDRILCPLKNDCLSLWIQNVP